MKRSDLLSCLGQISEFESEIIFERPLSTNGNTAAIQDKRDRLAILAKTARKCVACILAKTRTNVVFGVGNPDARLMFVGEGPGADEDCIGEPFVGRAGQLLDKMVAAMKYQRTDVYIANIVKCRPPENRNPLPDEVSSCKPFLSQQIDIVDPEVIVALGLVAATNLLQLETKVSLKSLRERIHNLDGRPLIVTYHPAALLRSSKYKAPAWQDLQQAMKLLSGDVHWEDAA